MKNLKYASLAIALIAAVSCSKNNSETVTTTGSAQDSVVAAPAVTDSLSKPAADSTKTSATAAAATDFSGYKVAATQDFTGEGKDLKAEYLANESDKRAVKFTFDGKTFTLPQTEAWAKGAIYKDGDVQFEDKGQVNTAVLTIGGKKYSFTQKK